MADPYEYAMGIRAGDAAVATGHDVTCHSARPLIWSSAECTCGKDEADRAAAHGEGETNDKA